MVEQCNTSCVKAVAEISMFSHFLGGGGGGGGKKKKKNQEKKTIKFFEK